MKIRKNILKFFLLTLILLFLISCKTEELPQSPKMPGQNGIMAGKAAQATTFKAYPSWAAKPENMFLLPESLEFGDSIRVKIIDYDFIYRYGYYFNPHEHRWVMFELEDGKKAEDWYLGKTAKATLEIHREDFERGENYLVLYACNKADGYFDCHENKWMLTYFRILDEGEEDIDDYIIDEDIDDFILLSKKVDSIKINDKKITTYEADYLKDNEKLNVKIAELETTKELEEFMSSWKAFEENYEKYGGNMISAYEYDNEYFVGWLSGKTAIKIKYSADEFPEEIVDEYLDKFPSTDINFTSTSLGGEEESKEETGDSDYCGDKEIKGTERCDPQGSQCVVETFSVQELTKGTAKTIDGHILRVLDIVSGNVIIMDVDGITQIMAENQIKEFSGKYIHIFRVLGSTVKLAFGYELGQCTSSCGCKAIGTTTNQTTAYCGNNVTNSGEECDPPNSKCNYKNSGIDGICTSSCMCSPPWQNFKFCGDRTVDNPNSLGWVENCDPPGPYVLGGVQGVCAANCRFIAPGIVPNQCGDGFLKLPEECDPPGAACLKNGTIGKCIAGCKCQLPEEFVEDEISLKLLLCGTNTPECFGIGKECTKSGKTGTCNAQCTCDVEEEQEDEDEQEEPQEPICGNEEIENNEQCDPPGTTKTENGITYTCTNECQWQALPRCGDEIINQVNEECDPPGIVKTEDETEYKCTVDCKWQALPRCGDGIINQESEECEPPESECYTVEEVQGICSDACTCMTEIIQNPFGDLTSNVILETEQEKSNRTMIFAIMGCIFMLGILLFNFMKK